MDACTYVSFVTPISFLWTHKVGVRICSFTCLILEIVIFTRPHGDPQMIRFGAHLVLVLRHLQAELKDAFKEKIMTLGDLILHM